MVGFLKLSAVEDAVSSKAAFKAVFMGWHLLASKRMVPHKSERLRGLQCDKSLAKVLIIPLGAPASPGHYLQSDTRFRDASADTDKRILDENPSNPLPSV